MTGKHASPSVNCQHPPSKGSRISDSQEDGGTAREQLDLQAKRTSSGFGRKSLDEEWNTHPDGSPESIRSSDCLGFSDVPREQDGVS